MYDLKPLDLKPFGFVKHGNWEFFFFQGKGREGKGRIDKRRNFQLK